MTSPDDQPQPDAGNTEDIDALTEPVSAEDDVYERLAGSHDAETTEQAPVDDLRP